MLKYNVPIEEDGLVYWFEVSNYIDEVLRTKSIEKSWSWFNHSGYTINYSSRELTEKSKCIVKFNDMPFYTEIPEENGGDDLLTITDVNKILDHFYKNLDFIIDQIYITRAKAYIKNVVNFKDLLNIMDINKYNRHIGTKNIINPREDTILRLRYNGFERITKCTQYEASVILGISYYKARSLEKSAKSKIRHHKTFFKLPNELKQALKIKE